MKQIISFAVDHTKLTKGIYLYGIKGDVVTYDLRMCIPNGGHYLENDALHTFEHLFATYVYNSLFAEQVIYIGPMGCRTGFYFLVRDTMTPTQVIALVQEACRFIATFKGVIPGSAEPECGNYLSHDLPGARVLGVEYGTVIADWTPSQISYPK